MLLPVFQNSNCVIIFSDYNIRAVYFNNMEKINFLLLLFFFSAANIQAQKCNCKASYEWVKKIFEENDAGIRSYS